MKISKKKLALFLVIAFFVGGTIGASGNQEKTAQITKNEIEWRDLKRVDDKIDINLNKTISACASNENDKYDVLTREYQFLSDERNLVLEKLGY